MISTRFIRSKFLLILLFIFSTQPGAGEFNVGYVKHPGAYQHMEIVRQVYKGVGINVTFVEMPVKRRLLALSEGGLDADMGAPAYVSEHFPNIIKLEPVVAIGSLFLFCSAEIGECDHGLLDQRKTPIFMDGVDAITSKRLITTPFTARINTLEHNNAIAEMFNTEKIDLFVDIVVNDKLFFVLERQHNRLKLGTVKYHHHINLRHKHLKSAIEASFDRVFAEIGITF